MFRLHPLVLAGVVVFVGGCTRATFGFRPSLTSQVPDSTVVRIRARDGQPSVTGRALDWQAGRPRIITPTGDTVAVPRTSTLEVRLKEKKTHAILGGVIGLGVGFSIKLVQCPPTNVCAPDLTPALTAGVGALIGSRFTAADWVRVKWISAAVPGFDGYSPRPANSRRLPSGSRTMNVRAPHGSVRSG